VLANGYRPIPVNGKIPHIAGWQDLAATPDVIKYWSDRYPDHTNTSLLTRTTPTLDVDVMDPEAAEAIEALVRELYEECGYILVRTGRPPKRAIPFRTDTPFPKILRTFTKLGMNTEYKIEMLGNGQQIVIDGVHPDTGKPYSWHGGSPDQIRHEDLPYITEDEARDLVAQAACILTERGYEEVSTKAKPNGDGAADDFGDYRADWSALIDRILKGHALHDSIRDLAAAVVASGMYDTAAERLIRSLMEASSVPHDERWQQRFDDIRRAINSARKKYGNDGKAEQATPEEEYSPSKFQIYDLADFCARDIKPREMLLAAVIPEKGLVMLYAPRGVGKTHVGLGIGYATSSAANF
jgi:8-oxo-dGTP pyrophosphatase MutT (NUDIX family)